MNYYRVKSLITNLAIGAVFIGSTANASDNRMWREQVPSLVEAGIVLESKTVDSKTKLANDSSLWREQVKITAKNQVFILEPASHRFAKSNDWQLWREQIKSDSSDNKPRMASNARQTDKDSDQ